jgi:hypothetical protein
MKRIITTAIGAALLGLIAVVFAAPAQAYNMNELIQKKRHAKHEFDHWDAEYVRLQHRVNRLYSRRDSARYNWRKLRKLDRNIRRLEKRRDNAGSEARFWQKEYRRYSRMIRKIRDRRHYRDVPRPRYHEPRDRPRRRPYRDYGGISFGIHFSDRNGGMGFFIGQH